MVVSKLRQGQLQDRNLTQEAIQLKEIHEDGNHKLRRNVGIMWHILDSSLFLRIREFGICKETR